MPASRTRRTAVAPFAPIWPSRMALVAILVLALAALCITSCAPSESPSTTAVTIVATATAAEPRPSLPDSLASGLVAMAKRAKRPGDATVHVVMSATGEVVTHDLTPLRPNGQVQHAQADADRQIRAALDDLAATVGALRATEPGLGVLPLLDRAGQLPGDLHVLTSGVSTEAPVDLRRIGWSTDPHAVIDSVEKQGLIPRLPGRHVTFYGLGVVAGQQPVLPPFTRSFIESLHHQLCERSGAASCRVAPPSATALPPVATAPVPVVPVPEAYTEAGCPVWTRLSDAVLHFAPDSAVLPASADDVLRPLAEAVFRCHIRRVDITGHIADTGTGDARDNLAQRRARAVADRLVSLGLPSGVLGAVAGRDAHEPVVPNFTNGVFDEAKAKQNRRVEMTFLLARR
ncbi:OmpA family protein [Nocardia puris]|uniref:OmpA family protein n=1 Tax=Nocardia puris TaxID=208602 RepID=A0A366DEQ0_9NOCA|nr:OmpA family protein [Nocardia puris]RBO88486.1 OmpA family protein [Nocardia puris]